MSISLKLSLLTLGSVCWLSACSNNDEVTSFSGDGTKEKAQKVYEAKDPVQAASMIQDAFQKSAAEERQIANEAAQALREHDYAKAVVRMDQLRSTSKTMSYDQLNRVKAAEIQLQAELMRKLESKDPKAIEAVNLMRNLRR